MGCVRIGIGPLAALGAALVVAGCASPRPGESVVGSTARAVSQGSVKVAKSTAAGARRIGKAGARMVNKTGNTDPTEPETVVHVGDQRLEVEPEASPDGEAGDAGEAGEPMMAEAKPRRRSSARDAEPAETEPGETEVAAAGDETDGGDGIRYDLPPLDVDAVLAKAEGGTSSGKATTSRTSRRTRQGPSPTAGTESQARE